MIKKFFVFILFLFFNYYIYALNSNKPLLKVYYLNIGQGDASVIVFPNGKVMEIDAAKAGAHSRDRGELVIIPFYESKGINKIDIALITHPDLDHIGGYMSILKELEVVEFWDSKNYTTVAYKTIINLIKKNDVKYLIGYEMLSARAEELSNKSFFGDGVRIKILGPLVEYLENDNNSNSICSKITYKNISFFFGGDTTKEAQQDMALTWKDELKSTVLMVPHHGSEHNYNTTFLSYVSPDIAVVSVGINNKYGHPSEKVMDGYKFAGVKILRTDLLQSHIEIITDGETFEINLLKSPFGD